MKTHLVYIAIIVTITFFAFFQKDGRKFETNLAGTKASTWSESDVFYAYISPNDPKVHIVNEYQPDVEYREINSITYLFIKGTDNMLVALNTSHSANQWVWDVHGRNLLKGYGLESIPRLDILPQQYQLAVYEHNKVHPHGKNQVGEVIVRALFTNDQYTVTYTHRPPGIDFSQF